MGTSRRTALCWVSVQGEPGLVSIVQVVLDWLAVWERSEHCCDSCLMLAAAFL